MGKPKAILFGASKAGMNYIYNQEAYEIIAVADNDVNKHGNIFGNYPIISPYSIADYNYNYIVVTSMYVKQISDQLLNELMIEPSKIIFPPKRLLKRLENPFEDNLTLKMAKALFFELINIFEVNKIDYFIEYGTLLGIKRDKDFIKWDDDIDFSIHPGSIERLLNKLNEIQKSLELKFNIPFTFTIRKMKSGLPIEIDITFDSEEYKEFEVNIGLIRFKGEEAIQIMNKISKEYYENYEEILFEGKIIRAPYKTEDYLTKTYGEWKIVKRNTSFNDNTLTFYDNEI